MTDGAGTTGYAYDPVGRLIESTRGGRSVGYGYDAAGRPTSVSYPGGLGTVGLAYDAEGRLATITDWDARVTTLAYDALDRPSSIDRPGGPGLLAPGLSASYALDGEGSRLSERVEASPPTMANRPECLGRRARSTARQ